MTQSWEIEGFLSVVDGRLHIDGVSAVDLATRFGTPLFVFSENRIRHNLARLTRARSLINAPLKVCYAAKALSTMSILKAVLDAGSDIEVNSGGELWKALKIGFSAEQIIFNGTSKEIWEIENAIRAGIFAIQVDSILELVLIDEVATRLRQRANVSLRLVPEIASATHSGLQTALLSSKFGMMPNEAVEAIRRFAKSPFLHFAGIHLHIGSQNPSASGYADALQVLFHNLLTIYRETGLKLSHLNLGGGFPVNYLRDAAQQSDFPEQQREIFTAEFDPADAVASAWHSLLLTARAADASHLLEGVTLLLEPGRSIVADAGVCLTSVRNIKRRPAQSYQSRADHETWILTDAGFNILLSMATYSWYYQAISAERADAAHDARYKLAGPLCDGGDVYFDIEGMGRLPEQRLLPPNVKLGEVLALLNCGAYSLSQASQYNARFLPPVVMISRDAAVKLIRRRDDFHDLIRNDVF